MDAVEAGEDCAYGGVSLRVGEGEPIFVCNGAPGATGADGLSASIATEPAGENCEHGGIAVSVGSGDPTYVCNGPPGAKGDKGDKGENGESVSLTAEPAGDNCARGGVKVQVGDDIRYVCHGDALTWHDLIDNKQAQPNAGYIAGGASDVTLTLPNTSQLRKGDVIRLVNSGTGSVSVKPNAGQTFRYAPGALATPSSFVARGPRKEWYSVASSADGTKLIAGAYMGPLYTSTDAGLTWTPRLTEVNRDWSAVASSAGGTTLIAGTYWGELFTSTDSGLTWTPRESERRWLSVASSADGTKLAAGVLDGQLYISTDSGVTWTPRASQRWWASIASSTDGTKLAAADYDGYLYVTGGTGSLVSRAPSAVELMYTGSGQFFVGNVEGTVEEP